MSLGARIVIIAAALAAAALTLVLSYDLQHRLMITVLTNRHAAVMERLEAVAQHLERSDRGLYGLRTWRAELPPQADPDTVLDTLAAVDEDWAADLHSLLHPLIAHLMDDSALGPAERTRFIHDYLEKLEDQWQRSLAHDLHEQTATIRAALTNITEDIERRQASLRLLRIRSP